MSLNDLPKCPTHNTMSAYINKGCRCDQCRENNTRRQAHYRATSTQGKKNLKVTARANAEAARRYRNEHPVEWKQLLDEVWDEVGGRKQPHKRRQTSSS